MKLETGYILVVDDNEMNREILARRLTLRGHTVDEAEDGREALQRIETNRYDLVLLDVMMPEVSGLEVLQKVRQKFTLADLPIIMATARDQSEDIVEALKLGANDYVTKPIDWPVVNARTQTQLKLRRLAQLKDEFLRMASHDLKNPLTCILGFASLLEMNVKPGAVMDAEMYGCIHKIADHANGMHRIIKDFLDFQAVKDGQLKLAIGDVDLNDVARQVLEQAEGYARGKGITLGMNLDSDLPRVQSDNARVLQVLENLVSNAIKFGPKGGQASLRTIAREDGVLVEVSDTGPGVSEVDLPKLFVRYALLSNRPTGGETSSRLGLSICKELIEALGGRIGARNNPGGGATFWFQIPMNPKVAE